MSRRRPALVPARPTSTATARRARLGAAVAAPALALALTACSATNPILTQANYDASDGLGVTVGEVVGGNLLVVADEQGAPGALIGSLTNRGSDREVLTVQLAPPADADDPTPSSPVSVTVPAGQTVLLGTEGGEQVEFDAVPVRPGGIVTVVLQTSDGGVVERGIPVLDGSKAVPEYATLAPTPSPTATS